MVKIKIFDEKWTWYFFLFFVKHDMDFFMKHLVKKKRDRLINQEGFKVNIQDFDEKWPARELLYYPYLWKLIWTTIFCEIWYGQKFHIPERNINCGKIVVFVDNRSQPRIQRIWHDLEASLDTGDNEINIVTSALFRAHCL